MIVTDQQWNEAFGVSHANCDDERAKRAAWAAATEPDARRVMIDEYVKVTVDHLRAANSGE